MNGGRRSGTSAFTTAGSSGDRAHSLRLASKSGPPAPPKHLHERPSPKSGGTAKTLRNDCKRLHVCNRVLKNGRVCGMRNHTSEACRK